MSGDGKRKFVTLRRSPLPTVVQREIVATMRPAESAKRTNKHIRSGMHPLAAHR
jgi:hypothetical protein